MVNYDEKEVRATSSFVEGATFATFPINNADRDLNIPVLTLVGGHDKIFCGMAAADCTSSEKMLEHERGYYGPGADVRAQVFPSAGHDLTLERSSPQVTAAMLRFSQEVTPRGLGAPNTPAGLRPPVTTAPSSEPTPAAQLMATGFLGVARPLADTYMDAARPVPGLGDTSNPLPVTTTILTKVSALVNQFAGDAMHDLLDGS